MIRKLESYCTPVGWLYLFLRFRDIQKMRRHRDLYYDGSYGVAGGTVVSYLVLSLMAVAVLAIAFLIFTGDIEGG